MRTHHLLPVLPTLVLAACSLPTYTAAKVVDVKLPVAGVREIVCSSHNGGITIVGDPAATEIALHAEVEIRAFSQEDASAQLAATAVTHDVVDGRLVVKGTHPAALSGKIATFRFTLTVPSQLALQLDTHNGDLVVRGLDGALQLETHNGEIRVDGASPRLAITTHNGDVQIDASGVGALDGEVQSHNGEITLTVAAARGTRLDAATHNGQVRWPDDAAEASYEDRHLRCRLGDGKGTLVLRTHNGEVAVRRPR